MSAISQVLAGFVSAASLAGPYSLVERFEGSQADSLGVVGYDNTGWTSSNDANNPRYATSPAPLAGSYSLRITLGGRYIERTVAGFGSTASIRVRYRNETFTADNTLLSIRDAANNQLAWLLTRNTNAVRVHCGSVNSLSTAFDVSNEMYIWFEYEKGSGTNAIARLYMSSSTITKPGSPILSVTTGTATADAAIVRINAGSVGIWDDLVCDGSPIGSDSL